MEIISTEGIQSLTTKNLAKQLGVSEPAIYRHFANKAAVLAGILEYFRSLTEAFLQEEVKSETPAGEAIQGFLHNNLRIFSAHPAFVTLIFSDEIFRSEPALLKAVGTVQQVHRSHLMTYLRSGQEKGEIRNDVPAEHLALMLLGTFRTFVNNWHQAGHPFPLLDKGKELVDSLRTVTAPV